MQRIHLIRLHETPEMAQAKQLHDELETFYVPNMDFARWQSIFSQTLTSIQT